MSGGGFSPIQGPMTPTQPIQGSFSNYSDAVKSDDSSDLSKDDITPKFDERTITAVFGNIDEIQACQMEQNEEEEKQILLRTLAGKKSRLIIYTTREVLLFSDGSLAYKRRNKSQVIKYIIKP